MLTPAHENMIKSQIEPLGNNVTKIIESFKSIPRYNFTPDNMKNFAYSDIAFQLEFSEKSFTPIDTAKILKASLPQKTDNVLLIGTGSGYLAGLVANLTNSVLCLDIHEELNNEAKYKLKSLGVYNLKFRAENVFEYDFKKSDESNYDLIIFAGATLEIQKSMFKYLDNNGRMLSIVGENTNMSIILTTKKGNEYTHRHMFNLVVPYLKGIKIHNKFSF